MEKEGLYKEKVPIRAQTDYVLRQGNWRKLNMGPKIETTRNPLGLGIYRNLILGSIFIF